MGAGIFLLLSGQRVDAYTLTYLTAGKLLWHGGKMRLHFLFIMEMPYDGHSICKKAGGHSSPTRRAARATGASALAMGYVSHLTSKRYSVRPGR